MPITEAQILDLRLRYATAYDAYHSCVRALVELGMKGERPTPQLLEKEAKR